MFGSLPVPKAHTSMFHIDLQTTCRSDEELAAAWCRRSDSDPPSLVVPKLCLMLAVMEWCGMASCTYQPTLGSCPGILVANHLYPEGATPTERRRAESDL